MGYSIKEASELDGTPSDRQIRRDIKSGKLRATKNSEGHNMIEGADLAIAYNLTISHDTDNGIAKKHDMSANVIGHSDELSYHVIDKNHPQIKALETEIKFEREQKEFFKDRYSKVEDRLTRAEDELTRSREMIQGLLPSPEKMTPLPPPPPVAQPFAWGKLAVVFVTIGALAMAAYFAPTLQTYFSKPTVAQSATDSPTLPTRDVKPVIIQDGASPVIEPVEQPNEPEQLFTPR